MRPPIFPHLHLARPLHRHPLYHLLSRSHPLPRSLLTSPPKTSLVFFSQSHRPANQYQPYLNHENHQQTPPPPRPPPFPPKRSIRSRLVRSLLWALLFGALGFQFTLGSYLTLYKFQSSIRLDSEADQRLALGLWKTIEASDPRLASFEASPALEEIWPLATDLELTRAMHVNPNPTRFHHLIYTALRGSRGVRARAFLKPSRCEMLVFVAFSYGLESAPEQGGCGALHNGAMATMVEESMTLLAQHWFPPEVSHKLANLQLSFAAAGDGTPLRANAAYHIFLQPAATCGLYIDQPAAVDQSHSHSHPLSFSDTEAAAAPKAMTVMDTEIAMPIDLIPEWFDPTNWNDVVNSFVAIVVPVGMPGSRGGKYRASTTSMGTAAVCFGRFDVEIPKLDSASGSNSDAEAEATPELGSELESESEPEPVWPPRPPKRPESIDRV